MAIHTDTYTRALSHETGMWGHLQTHVYSCIEIFISCHIHIYNFQLQVTVYYDVIHIKYQITAISEAIHKNDNYVKFISLCVLKKFDIRINVPSHTKFIVHF